MRNSAVFEEEVRKFAGQLFPGLGSSGPVIIDGRERDSVIDTGENIHIIEATCDPRKSKANQDLNKSIELKRKLTSQYPNHNFHIWFITEKDPTADQMAEAAAARKRAKCPVTATSLNSFSQRLVNSSMYLSIRQHYHFGSVRHLNPNAASKFVSEDEFVAIDLIDLESKRLFSREDIANAISLGQTLVLVGEYGSGKSMTMRDLYFKSKSQFHKNETSRFPIYLNLRDHVGQDEASSAIYDHGAKIGYSNPEQLVRAWRAGFTHVFLDGFDEIASSRFRSGSEGLREVRRRAMTLIRKFVEQHPFGGAALVISGRQNYFGGDVLELSRSLGLRGRLHKIISLSEFSIEQLDLYLKRLGTNVGLIPDWFPSRPLLVGYLAVKGLLSEDGFWLKNAGQAESWDYLLDKICEREGSQIDDLGGQADQVRDYVDRLATKARSTSSGRGPLTVADMTEIFRQIFPSTPDEAAQQLLVRLAGVAGSSEVPSAVTTAAIDQGDSREFVDDDLVDVARAGDVVKFIKYPYNDEINELLSDKNMLTAMFDLGLEVATSKAKGFSAGQLSAALIHAADTLSAPYLAFEILRIMQALNVSVTQNNKRSHSIVIAGGIFHYMPISGIEMSSVVFRDCIFSRLDIDAQADNSMFPRFEACLFQEIIGISSEADLSKTSFVGDENEFGSFVDEVDTNNDVRRLPLSEPVRVLVISLRKLFLQSGGGRKESALHRGLNDMEKPYVKAVLSEISRSKCAHLFKGVWIPSKTMRSFAYSIIEFPQQANNPLIEAVKNLIR